MENKVSALNEAIKNSKNPEVTQIKGEIDELKRQRSDIIVKIKGNRRKLSYKEAEAAAIAKLLEIERQKGTSDSKRRKIGQLKRLKQNLEFKISTEASSLAAEKDLVRKIAEVNAELNEAYKVIRLERKQELVKGDLLECNTNIEQFGKQIVEMDKKLDDLYAKIRGLLGREGFAAKQQMMPPRQKKQQIQQNQEINLEDIAVIKKKPAKKVEEPI
jgi:uncharacterized coiled-coil DUF342 family protein